MLLSASRAGLCARHSSGAQGRLIEEWRASSMIGDTIMDLTLNGRVQVRDGNRHPELAPHGVYPCQGGRLDQYRGVF
jgi:crotonobetainyl-CoA:carnitine CoA-transferase CaiB-like acyl-CoA transferase